MMLQQQLRRAGSRLLVLLVLSTVFGVGAVPCQDLRVPSPLRCGSVDVLAVELTTTIDPDLTAAAGLSIRLELAADDPATGQLQLDLLGPVLGSMDEIDATPTLRCAKNGVTLAMGATRSDQYLGGVHKNVLKRARMRIRIRTRNHTSTFSAIWTLRLPNGVRLTHAQTPPYPDLAYPLIASVNLLPGAAP